jgi:hypothetical protein
MFDDVLEWFESDRRRKPERRKALAFLEDELERGYAYDRERRGRRVTKYPEYDNEYEDYIPRDPKRAKKRKLRMRLDE